MITTKERAGLQLVCRRIRDEIRIYAGIGARVDELGYWG